jgi:hypothetical protein
MSEVIPIATELQVPTQPEPAKRQRRGLAHLPLPTRRLLNLRQAADYLAMGEDSLRKIIYAREIPVIRGRSQTAPHLVDVKDLDEWIMQNKSLF